MTYQIHEIFYSLQGEGAKVGRPSVFCRFSGCNLWSGKAKTRSKAICQFCDTDFVGTSGVRGGVYSAAELAWTIAELWPWDMARGVPPYVILTGGEPLLQVDSDLIQALHDKYFEIGLETNGTVPIPKGIDWVCVSPKLNTTLVVPRGNELKVAMPQDGLDLNRLSGLAFDQFFLQPIWGPNYEKNLKWCIDYCLSHPLWRLSLQTHKIIGVP